MQIYNSIDQKNTSKVIESYFTQSIVYQIIFAGFGAILRSGLYPRIAYIDQKYW